jgi:hypothetical protein
MLDEIAGFDEIRMVASGLQELGEMRELRLACRGLRGTS